MPSELNGKDIADVHFRVSVRTAYKVVAGVAAFAIVLAGGWWSLKQDVAEARTKFTELEPRVARIECLIQQQTDYQIYKRIPTSSCR